MMLPIEVVVGRVPGSETPSTYRSIRGYDVYVTRETLEVVFTPPFDSTAGPQVRALIRVARDLGMTVRARVRPAADRPRSAAAALER